MLPRVTEIGNLFAVSWVAKVILDTMAYVTSDVLYSMKTNRLYINPQLEGRRGIMGI